MGLFPAREALWESVEKALVSNDELSRKRAARSQDALFSALEADEEIRMIGVDEGAQRYVVAVTDRRIIVAQGSTTIASLSGADIAETRLLEAEDSEVCATIIEPIGDLLGRFGGAKDITVWFGSYDHANTFACFIDESLLGVVNSPVENAVNETALSSAAWRAARDTLDAISDFLGRKFRCSRLEIPALQIGQSPILGFGAARNGVLALFSAHVGSGGAGSWMLQMCSLLAVDVPDIDGALAWVNEKNRLAHSGKHYCVIAEKAALAAVVYVSMVPGALPTQAMDAAGAAEELVMSYLFGLANDNMTVSEQYTDEVISSLGGHALAASEQDLMTLFWIASY